MAAGIRTVSTVIIRAASGKNESIERIELSPWDIRLLLIEPIQKGLLFHKPHQQSFVTHLKTSLSRILDFFPPLAGRIAVATSEGGNDRVSYSIDCNNAGALFVHATADELTLSDVVSSVYVPPVVHSFFPLNGSRNDDGTSKPLLAVQVTELADGIFIGFTVNHAVADGSSFWGFVNSWSEISRGLGQPSKPPVFQRWLPSGISFPIPVPEPAPASSQTRIPVFALSKERIFHFSRQKIERLKEKANAEIDESSIKISSLQAFLAHLWRSLIRNSKNLDPDQTLTYRLPIGLRQRLKSHLPEDYFGNAIHPGIIAIKARNFLKLGLGHVAMEMNKMIGSHTEDQFISFLRSWVENPQMVTFGSSVGNTSNLVTTNSPRFDAYGNDFGWGKPVAVRSGAANKGSCGIVTVYPGRDEGSLDVEICVLSEILEAMEGDPKFMEAVTC